MLLIPARFRSPALLLLLTALSLAAAPAVRSAEAVGQPLDGSRDLHVGIAEATTCTSGWNQPQIDRSVTGQPLAINGVAFAHGIGTHARAEIVYPVAGHYRWVTFYAGIAQEEEGGTVRVQVWGDGRKLHETDVLRSGDDAVYVSVPITGVRELRLVGTDAGDGIGGDHLDLGLLRLAVGEQAPPGEVVIPSQVKLPEKLRPRATAPGRAPEFSTAGFFPVAGGPRRVLDFDAGWRFAKGANPGAEAVGFDDAAWEGVDLPHGLEVLGENASGGRNYQGPAWYRKRFALTPDFQGVLLRAYFAAVMGKCRVWVNGKELAQHFGGYLPFAVDLTGAVDCSGTDNVIAVWADNSDDPSYPPGHVQNGLDFAYLGGIYRDVRLIVSAPLAITLPELVDQPASGGVQVATTALSGRDATLAVRTHLANAGDQPRSGVLRSILLDAQGAGVGRLEQPFQLAAHADVQFAQVLAVPGAHLWHPDDPYLHDLLSEVVVDGAVVDSLKTRFGIRLFEMRGSDGLFVNNAWIGHPLSGANRHQDYAYVGNALPDSGQWRDALLLREGGCTVVRAAHYPLSPAFMDACDALGLFVTVANPGWQFYNATDPLFAQRLQSDAHQLARRDRNRPAVLLWETAINETPEQPIAMVRALGQAVHEEIPFPGVFTIADNDLAKPAGLDAGYFGIPKPGACTFGREYGDGGEVEGFWSQNAVTRVKREWGEAALLGQARSRARDLDGLFAGGGRENMGAALWCGIDHQRGYHPDPFWGGLLDEFRVPRYSYLLFQSQYDPGLVLPGVETGPMVAIVHELTQVSGHDVVVYSNCEEVRLTWLSKVIGTQRPDGAGKSHLPHPPFTFAGAYDFAVVTRSWRDRLERAEMVAEGLIGGVVVCRTVKHYPQRTTGVKLVLDGRGVALRADGSDFVPVRAYVVDGDGRTKVLASEQVHFAVSGAGRLVGDASTQADPMKAQFGVATALVRAGVQPGEIRVTAWAQGLKPDTLVLTSQAAALPLVYSSSYREQSRRPAVIALATPPAASPAGTPADLARLAAENERLRGEKTSLQQEIMELRSRLGR